MVLNAILLVGNFFGPQLRGSDTRFFRGSNRSLPRVHLGIIMVVNMEIGLVTPPVGLNLFVTTGVAGVPIEAVVGAAVPWLAVLLGVLLTITCVPLLSLAVLAAFEF